MNDDDHDEYHREFNIPIPEWLGRALGIGDGQEICRIGGTAPYWVWFAGSGAVCLFLWVILT